jgi:geranylgeranyl pyrophosphate synthase
VRDGVETDEDLQEVVDFVYRYQGIESAREEARTYARSAVENLDGLDASDARSALELTAQHVVERER